MRRSHCGATCCTSSSRPSWTSPATACASRSWPSASRRSSWSNRPTTARAWPASSNRRARGSTTSASRSRTSPRRCCGWRSPGWSSSTLAAEGSRGAGRVHPPALVPWRARRAHRGAGRPGVALARVPAAVLKDALTATRRRTPRSNGPPPGRSGRPRSRGAGSTASPRRTGRPCPLRAGRSSVP